MQFVSVQAVASRLKDHFSVDMDLDQVIIHTGQVLKNLGMIALNREVIRATVDNYQVNLPSRVWKPREVIYLDGYPTDNIIIDFVSPIPQPPQTFFVINEPDVSSISTIEFRNNYVPLLRGPYIDFKWEAPYLRFNENNISVAVICTSIKCDENGWPMIPEEAFEAAVYYCLYTHYQPLYLMGKIDGGRMQTIQQWKNQKLGFAENKKMMSELNANEMNKVLDILTSFDRKRFGIPS